MGEVGSLKVTAFRSILEMKPKQVFEVQMAVLILGLPCAGPDSSSTDNLVVGHEQVITSGLPQAPSWPWQLCAPTQMSAAVGILPVPLLSGWCTGHSQIFPKRCCSSSTR